MDESPFTRYLGIGICAVLQILIPVLATKYFYEQSVSTYEHGASLTPSLFIQGVIGVLWAAILFALIHLVAHAHSSSVVPILATALLSEIAVLLIITTVFKPIFSLDPRMIVFAWGASLTLQLVATLSLTPTRKISREIS